MCVSSGQELSSQSRVDQRLEAIQKIRNEEERSADSIELLSDLPSWRSTILQEALKTALQIEDEGIRTLILSNIATHLNKSLREEVLREVEQQEKFQQFLRLHEFSKILKYSRESDKYVKNVLELQINLNKSWNILLDLVNDLSKPEQRTEVQEKALSDARQIEDRKTRALTLSNIAAYLDTILRKLVQEEALSNARQIEDRKTRALTLSHIATRLSEPQQKEVFPLALRLLACLFK